MSDSQDEKLRTTYDQLCNSYRAIDDFRAKLLGFLPLATGTGIFLLIPDNPGDGSWKTYLLPIGAFGFLITCGLFSYELYGIKRCHGLIKAGQQLEGKMGIRGQFKERARGVAHFINEPFAAGVIYPAVLAAWMFLLLQGLPLEGQKSSRLEIADVLIALCVFVGGCAISVAYNRRLAKEKTFLAELLDHKGCIVDESFFGSHDMAGARKSAKNWAKKSRKYENAAIIKLIDADDVTITEDVELEAASKGVASP